MLNAPGLVSMGSFIQMSCTYSLYALFSSLCPLNLMCVVLDIGVGSDEEFVIIKAPSLLKLGSLVEIL
jgi:hypothetical protein